MKLVKFVFGLAVFVAILAILGRIFLFEIVQTESYSMVPNLIKGDFFLAQTVRLLGRGDIAVCENPEDSSRLVTLRIVGLPGDKIEVIGEHIHINDEMVQHASLEPILYEDNTSEETFEYAVHVRSEKIGGQLYAIALMDNAKNRTYTLKKVPDNHFFLLGDNRQMSEDSRHFGPVDIDTCIGGAFFLLWPAKDSGDLIRKTRMLSWIS